MKQSIMLICLQTEKLSELQSLLTQSEFNVTKSEGTQNAMVSIAQHNPAFLLLDFDMKNAADFLHEISSSPLLLPPPYILIATTFSKGPGRAAMYDLGADACIEKPIDPSEVAALVRAVLRREHKLTRLNTGRLLLPIKHKDLLIDPTHRIVTMCGETVALSPKEYDVLMLLAEHAGFVLTPKTIYETVWKSDYEFANNRVIDSIYFLRKKLGLDSSDSEYIETVHRIGYRFNHSM